AHIDAWKILSVSMCSTSTTPMPKAQRRRMRSSKTARLSPVSFLESSRPAGRGLYSATAPARTDPARGPQPGSSTPTTSSPAAKQAAKSCEGVPESMRKIEQLMIALSPAALLIASCGQAQSGDSAGAASSGEPFAVEDKGTFDSPWAVAFAPGTQVLFIT